MRTIIWFIYFWGYLLFALPKMKRAQRLQAAGELDARDALVEPMIQKWARALLRLAGVQVELTGLENIPEGPAVFVPNHQSYFDIPGEEDPPYPHLDGAAGLRFHRPGQCPAIGDRFGNGSGEYDPAGTLLYYLSGRHPQPGGGGRGVQERGIPRGPESRRSGKKIGRAHV